MSDLSSTSTLSSENQVKTLIPGKGTKTMMILICIGALFMIIGGAYLLFVYFYKKSNSQPSSSQPPSSQPPSSQPPSSQPPSSQPPSSQPPSSQPPSSQPPSSQPPSSKLHSAQKYK